MDAIFLILTRRFARILLAGGLFFLLGSSGHAQKTCVSPDRINALKTEIESRTSANQNSMLAAEILKLKAELLRQTAVPVDRSQASANPKQADEWRKTGERLCTILANESWPVKSTVGAEAASAWMRLVRNYFTDSFQRALVPVIEAAVVKNELDKDLELAAMVDRLRLSAGQPQIFGTQAKAENGFLVLLPVLSEARADAWRADYNLGTLRDQMRGLEIVNKMPLVRSTAKISRLDPTPEARKPDENTSLLKTFDEENDVAKVETSLVTIDAIVLGPAGAPLEKTNFKVFEDNKEQEITVFGASDAPLDIVLLLDLSASTADKLKLIRNTTKRFIEMKRDVDRVAVITFAGKQTVVSPLETDKAKLLERAGKLKDSGDSKVWDAVKFSMDTLKAAGAPGRRKALVVMTDGVDNALYYEAGFGSKLLFADLVEEVRNSSIQIFPIFLDMQGSGNESARVYADARRTLQLLADDSGGNLYTAKDVVDLNAVYDRVLKDVGRIYSLGYEPVNSRRDGSWRSIRVEIAGRPEFKVRARSGYYAK